MESNKEKGAAVPHGRRRQVVLRTPMARVSRSMEARTGETRARILNSIRRPRDYVPEVSNDSPGPSPYIPYVTASLRGIVWKKTVWILSHAVTQRRSVEEDDSGEILPNSMPRQGRCTPDSANQGLAGARSSRAEAQRISYPFLPPLSVSARDMVFLSHRAPVNLPDNAIRTLICIIPSDPLRLV